MEEKLIDNKELQEVVSIVEEIGKELRGSWKTNREFTKEEYAKWLNALQGCYMYLKPLYTKFSAIKRNNEDAKYVSLLNDHKEGKFVSAVAERVASDSVGKYRYIRDYLEGWVSGVESIIYTLRNHLRENVKDVQVTLND